MAQSQISVLGENELISALIYPDSSRWIKPLVQSIFNKEEAYAIFNMCISSFPSENKLLWRCTNDGNFLLKSAYYFQLDLDCRFPPSSAPRDPLLVNMWPKVWYSNMPPVEKNFIIPTRSNLKLNYVLQMDNCPVCIFELETITHILWECPLAKDVWSPWSNTIQKSNLFDFTCMDLVLQMENYLYEFELFLFIVRQLWLRRSKFIFEGVFQPPSQLFQLTTRSLEEC